MSYQRGLGRGLLATAVVLGLGDTAHAFSQYSPMTPTGHEFLVVDPTLTRSLVADFPELSPKDQELTYATANCGLGCEGYDTYSHAVWSTVIGQRWVDTMGFVYRPYSAERCFSAVAQDGDGIMYEHFLRKRGDFNGCGSANGRVNAIKGSISRFEELFAAAAGANEDIIDARDGGFTASHYKVKRAYFLFGRAVHLFQDSFSTEHSIRKDGEILDIKSYFCTPDVPLHKHEKQSWFARGLSDKKYASHGDIIWKSAFGSHKVSNLKPHARLAHYAMVDLWYAFMRAHKNHASIPEQLKKIVDRWFKYDKDPKKPPPGLEVPTAAEFAICSFQSVAKVEYDAAQCLGKLTGPRAYQGEAPFDWKVIGPTDTIYDGDLQEFRGEAEDNGAPAPSVPGKFKPSIAKDPPGNAGLAAWEAYLPAQLTSCIKQFPTESCEVTPPAAICQPIVDRMREHGPRVQSEAVARALGAPKPTSILAGWAPLWPDDPATVRKVDKIIRGAIKPEIDLWFSGGPQQKRTLAALAATRTELANTERTLRPTKSIRSEFIFDQTNSFRFVQQLQINTFAIHWVPSTEEAGNQALAAITAKNSASFKRIVDAGNGSAKPAQFETLNARIAWLARSEVEEATRRSIVAGHKEMEAKFGPEFGRIQTRAQGTFAPAGKQIVLVPGVSPLLQAAPSSGTGVTSPPRTLP